MPPTLISFAQLRKLWPVASAGGGVILTLVSALPSATPVLQTQLRENKTTWEMKANGEQTGSGRTRFQSGATAAMDIDTTNARVGIGKQNPKTTLETLGTASSSLLTVTGLKSCNTIDTNAAGVLACGTDEGTGGGGTFGTGNVITIQHATDNSTSTGHLVTVFGFQFVQSSTGTLRSVFDSRYLANSTGGLRTAFGSQFVQSSTGSLQARFDGKYLASSTGSLRTAFTSQFLSSSTGSLKTAFGLQFLQSSTGSLRAVFDSRYLANSTGGLRTAFGSQFVQSSTGSLRSSLYTAGQGLTKNGGMFSLNSSNSGSLSSYTTQSGSKLFARLELLSSGSLVVEGASTLVGTVTIPNVADFSASTGDSTISGGDLFVTGGTFILSGGEARLYGGNVMIGANESANTALEVSGTMSGNTLTITNLKNCDTLDTNLNGVLSCGTDATSATPFGTGNVIMIISGTALTSSTGSLKTNFGLQFVQSSTGSLRAVFDSRYLANSTGGLRTAFGSQFVQSSTGALRSVFDSRYLANSTGGLRTAFGFQFVQSSTGSLQARFDGKYLGSSTGSLRANLYGFGQGLSRTAGGLVTLNSTITGSLVKFTTISGSALYAKDSLRSSGSLAWETSASGASIWVSTFDGAGLVDCDGDAQTLAWDTTTKKFSCGDDDTAAGGADLTMAFADTRYVRTQGDTMTGGLLIVNDGLGTQAIQPGVLLEITGAMSGQTLQLSSTLAASGSLTIAGGSFLKNDLTLGGGNINFTEGTTIGDGGDPIIINSSGTLTVQDILDISDNNMVNVGDIALDSLSSDAAGAINIILGSDAGDDFIVDTAGLVYEGDTNNVGIGTTAPEAKLEVLGTISGSNVVSLSAVSPANLPILVVASGSSVGAGTGKVFFPFPRSMTGFILAETFCRVDTAGTTGLTTIDLKNVTKGRNFFTKPVMIGSGRTGSGTAHKGGGGTVNAANDDVGGDDSIQLNITQVNTTAPKGLACTLTFVKP